MPFHIALYEPDIALNVGTILRLGACVGVPVHVIEPCGFPFSRRALKRSLMDYEAHIELTRHADWEAFNSWLESNQRRLVLASTKASAPYTEFAFRPSDVLLMGSESSGVPDHVHNRADAKIRIPMRKDLRSINVALSTAMLTGEAIRQLGPHGPAQDLE